MPSFASRQSKPGRFNNLRPHSNDMQKVIDNRYTFMLSYSVFANQNPRRSAYLAPAASHPLHIRHRGEKPLAATPLVPADCKCPLPQPLSLHILTNAPGVWGSTLPFLKYCLNSTMRQSIPFVFTLMRTLLCTPKTQLISFLSIPHSLRKIPGGGRRVRRARQR
jgi:hypothetical protein